MRCFLDVEELMCVLRCLGNVCFMCRGNLYVFRYEITKKNGIFVCITHEDMCQRR